jgi:serine/threonine protein kinase
MQGDSLPKFEVPYYKQGNIVDHNRCHPDINKIKQITQIAAGISHLHEKGINHGNICPACIFINKSLVPSSV